MTTNTIMPTYGRLDVTFERGEGVWLFDRHGDRYLDALSGIAVCGLGHAHPAVTKALSEQAASLIHTSNLYCIRRQQELADRLISVSGMDNVFFSNSGAEANEAAIKIARKYGHGRGIDKPAIIVMDDSFHGRTLATLSATGNRKVQVGFEPLVSGFVRAPLGDLDALKKIAANNPNIVAVLVEPIQGEGGIRPAPEGYLQALRDICDEHQWLMMLDEIQTGNGRTGAYFAYKHHDVIPDVLTTAKGLGNGVPIGACLARGAAADVLQPGNHGSTYGGNPLACSAAIAVMDTIETEGLCARANNMGRRLMDGLRAALAGAPQVREVRGAGLMVGIQLTVECGQLVKQALEQRLLINVTAGSVVRLLPPLIISGAEVDQIIETVSALIKALPEKAAS